MIDEAYIRRRYVVALSIIALLALCAYWALTAAISTQDGYASILNVSSRQRMLSQRIAMLTQDHANASDPSVKAKTGTRLKEAIDLFERSNRDLIQGSAAHNLPGIRSHAVRMAYFEGPEPVAPMVAQYVSLARSALWRRSGPQSAEVQATVRMATGPLLRRLDDIVEIYEGQAHADVARTLWLERGVLTLTLLALLAEALMIFRPLERAVVAAQRTREAALIDARQSEEAQSNLLANMSHEFRTPLNGVIGMADLLSQSRLDKEQALYVDTIVQSGEALQTLVGDILEITKLESGGIEIENEPFDLRHCLQGVTRLLTPAAVEKGIALELVYDDTIPPQVSGDVSRIRQVVINLVGNAVKFTEAGSVTVTAAPEPAIDGVRIAVTDTGIGIADDRLEHVFQRFTQENSSICMRFGGSGLGLTISRMLARAMGGEVEVASRVGTGSTFTVRLPLPGDTRAPPHADAATAPETAPGALRGRRILVAEDNRTNRLVISKLLKSTGADLCFAEDGAEALSLHAEFRPDVILMDISMPNLDGVEATRKIRAGQAGDKRGCAIIGLTAHAFAEDRQRCLIAGMSDFLSKPVRRDALLSRLYAASEPLVRL